MTDDQQQRSGAVPDEIRDLLPDWVAGRLDSATAARVRGVVEANAELAAEAKLLRVVASAAPAPPEGLDRRIVAALKEETNPLSLDGERKKRGAFQMRWTLAAAAVAVVAFGVIRTVEPTLSGVSEDTLSDLVVFEDESAGWIGDGVVVAGGTVLDELTEDDLDALLQELGG